MSVGSVQDEQLIPEGKDLDVEHTIRTEFLVGTPVRKLTHCTDDT
jgi:hypothetical protein